ncbi:MAG: mannose-6-phosphate isomerase, class I, partial [Myxococcota bacterium]
GDAGVLAPLLLNLVVLAPKEGLFLRPRELHAYLKGTALEIMANSDNVLRGGLTPKHVDVDELIKVLDFKPDVPSRITAIEDFGGWSLYPTPAPQFSLRHAIVDDHCAPSVPSTRGLNIVLCTRGRVACRTDDNATAWLTQGESAVLPAAAGGYRLEGNGEVFRASVGANTSVAATILSS